MDALVEGFGRGCILAALERRRADLAGRSGLRRSFPGEPTGYDANTFAEQDTVYLKRPTPLAPAPATVSALVPLMPLAGAAHGAATFVETADSAEICTSPAVDQRPLVPPSGDAVPPPNDIAMLIEPAQPVPTEPVATGAGRAVEERAPEVVIETAPVAHDTGGEILVPIPPMATRHAPEPRTAESDHTGPADDWSLFDPDRCRYAALLAKLDEITTEP